MTTNGQVNRQPRRMTIRPAYVVSATAFALLAAIRAGQDELGWSGLFVLVALVNAWLAIQPAARLRGRPSSVLATTRLRHGRVETSGEAALRRARTWSVLAWAAMALAVVLVAVAPASAVLAALTALGAMFRARRLRHAGCLKSIG